MGSTGRNTTTRGRGSNVPLFSHRCVMLRQFVFLPAYLAVSFSYALNPLGCIILNVSATIILLINKIISYHVDLDHYLLLPTLLTVSVSINNCLLFNAKYH